jgi:glutaredoxin
MLCAAHGLATGPDGRCIICRREATARPGARRRSLAAILAVALVVLGGVAIAARVNRHEPVAAVAPPAVAEEPTTGIETEPVVVQHTDTPPPAHATPPRDLVAFARPTGSFGNAAPPPSGVASSKTSPSAQASSVPPSREQIQSALRGVPIVMFSTSWCPSCARARSFLQANGITYRERDIDHDQAALDELKRRSGDTLIPTMEIDGRMLRSGFDQSAITSTLAASLERRLGVTGIHVQFER